MDHRLLSISKAVAESAIDAYNNYAIFRHIHYYGASKIVCKVYNELIMGVKNKINIWKLAKLITTVALIAHRQDQNPYATSLDSSSSALFARAHIAAHASLRKMIRETNYQRRLSTALNF